MTDKVFKTASILEQNCNSANCFIQLMGINDCGVWNHFYVIGFFLYLFYLLTWRLVKYRR